MKKIILQSSGTDASVQKKRARLAEQLGCCPEDIIVVPADVTVAVIDVPDEMIRDAAAKRQAAQRLAEQKDAEAKKAAGPQEAAAAAKAPAEADYDSWTTADLHAEASRQDVPGRSGMDKAALVKALKKK